MAGECLILMMEQSSKEVIGSTRIHLIALIVYIIIVHRVCLV